MQIDNPVLKAAKDDVAAVLSDGGAYARVQELFDLVDEIAVFPCSRVTGLCRFNIKQRIPRDVVLHNCTEHRGLTVGQSTASVLVAVMKSGPKKTAVIWSMANRRRASGEPAAAEGSENWCVRSPPTIRPGLNFKVAGFGVASVSMNIAYPLACALQHFVACLISAAHPMRDGTARMSAVLCRYVWSLRQAAGRRA